MKLDDKIIRLKVAELKNAGLSISQISKRLGISYTHAKQIYNQEEA